MTITNLTAFKMRNYWCICQLHQSWEPAWLMTASISHAISSWHLLLCRIISFTTECTSCIGIQQTRHEGKVTVQQQCSAWDLLSMKCNCNGKCGDISRNIQKGLKFCCRHIVNFVMASYFT
jgi:hypothetical protein